MKPINESQKKIYEFLLEKAKDGITPSVREICAAVGLRSTSSVQANLDALEAAGYIERPPLLKRVIKICAMQDNVTQVPLLGTVTAGMPILTVEEIEGYLPFSQTGASNKELFALRVRGESMINVGIMDGDLILVEQQKTARNGEIVVAMIDGFESEATVKTFYHEGDHIRLQPENDTMSPIIVRDVSILGKVKGVFRYFS